MSLTKINPQDFVTDLDTGNAQDFATVKPVTLEGDDYAQRDTLGHFSIGNAGDITRDD